jgi:very-short-patch-repair endonuclease
LRTLTTAGRTIVADIPVNRVVSLPEVDIDDLAQVLAGEPGELAPLVTRVPDSCNSPGAFAEAAVAELERAAVGLLPAWLPGTSESRPDLGGLAAARLLAAELARRGRYPRRFLTDLAVLSLTGRRPPTASLPLRIRARELARLVAVAFGRRRTVLLVDGSDGDGPGVEAVVAGAEWLVSSGGPAVWLLGTTSERVPAVRVGIPADKGSVAVAGRPHPGSTVEAALEAALARESWATGRRWNQDYRSNALTPPVRLDLWWPAERCVVEIDGPEHCRPDRYELDRRRDVRLTLDGYAVLRFTNARIIHDVGAVVHEIGTFVRAQRRDTAEGNNHGRR